MCGDCSTAPGGTHSVAVSSVSFLLEPAFVAAAKLSIASIAESPVSKIFGKLKKSRQFYATLHCLA